MEHQEHHETEHHGGSMGTYNLIFLVLVVITAIELAVAEIAGVIGAVLLLSVTAVKAGLVVAYYMHLKYDRPLYTWLFVVPMIMAVAVIASLQGLAAY